MQLGGEFMRLVYARPVLVGEVGADLPDCFADGPLGVREVRVLCLEVFGGAGVKGA